MHQPDGFNDGSDWVCKLNRCLYGLKKAPECWNQQFVDFIKKQGPKFSTVDPRLFVCQRNGKKLIVAIHVDDNDHGE
jgi:hypothetical protein